MTCYYPDLGSTSNCLKQISLAVRPIRSTTQDLASDTSSEWNFCTRSSGVTSRGNKWWRRKMSAVFSGSIQAQSRRKYVLETTSVCKNLEQLGQFILLQKLQTVLYFLTSKLSNCSILSFLSRKQYKAKRKIGSPYILQQLPFKNK